MTIERAEQILLTYDGLGVEKKKEALEAIRLAAIKEGMTKAVQLLPNDPMATIHIGVYVKSILTARDNLTHQ